MTKDDKYKLEYAEVGDLRRHYSEVRSNLTTFALTASLGAFAGYFSQEDRTWYLKFVGFFMLSAALLVCFLFSYRCEIANIYARSLWKWFGGQDQNDPPHFYDFKPKRGDVVKEMCRDEMNWVMVAVFLLITIVFCHCSLTT